jgi:hypothetical protein
MGPVQRRRGSGRALEQVVVSMRMKGRKEGDWENL